LKTNQLKATVWKTTVFYKLSPVLLSSFVFSDTFDTLAGVLHLLTGKIRPLIQAQITLPPRVKQNQLQHLNNLLAKLEEAISIKVSLFTRKTS
jgi:uncharacterized membrane protein YccC